MRIVLLDILPWRVIPLITNVLVPNAHFMMWIQPGIAMAAIATTIQANIEEGVLYAGIISIPITVISKAEGNYAVHPAVIQNRIHKEAI